MATRQTDNRGNIIFKITSIDNNRMVVSYSKMSKTDRITMKNKGLTEAQYVRNLYVLGRLREETMGDLRLYKETSYIVLIGRILSRHGIDFVPPVIQAGSTLTYIDAIAEYFVMKPLVDNRLKKYAGKGRLMQNITASNLSDRIGELEDMENDELDMQFDMRQGTESKQHTGVKTRLSKLSKPAKPAKTSFLIGKLLK